MARLRDRNQATTREIISALCEGGDFHEYGQLVLAGQRRKLGLEALIDVSPADGIVTGVGAVNADRFAENRTQVALLAYDSTVMAGTQGFFGHLETDRMIEVARDQGLATVFFTEGYGGRPNDDDFAQTVQSGLKVTNFAEFTRLRGWGPRITVNSGFCFAGNAALFGAGDIRIVTRNSWIGLAGPAMIEAGGIGSFSPKEIGPAPMHARNGLLVILAEDDAAAIKATRDVLSYFQGDLPTWEAADQRPLRQAIPENRKRSYLIRPVIQGLADTGRFLELGAQQAAGVIANKPAAFGGRAGCASICQRGVFSEPLRPVRAARSIAMRHARFHGRPAKRRTRCRSCGMRIDLGWRKPDCSDVLCLPAQGVRHWRTRDGRRQSGRTYVLSGLAHRRIRADGFGGGCAAWLSQGTGGRN